MPCPTESRTLDEFEGASPTYTNRQGSKLRKNLAESGIVVYNAVLVGGIGKDDEDNYKAKLEEILGQSIGASRFVDSAWGRCDCQKVRKSNAYYYGQ